VGEHRAVPLVAPLHVDHGEHGARVVVDDVEGIPCRVDHFVSGLQHLGGGKIDRPPVDVDHILVDLVVSLAEAWALPDKGAPSERLDEAVQVIDEIALELFGHAVSFVATDVDEGRRLEDRCHLTEQLLEALPRCRIPSQLPGVVSKNLGIALPKNRRVGGHVELGNDRHAPRLAVGLELHEVVPRPARTGAQDLGKSLRRPGTELVVGNVELQVVDLVEPAQIDHMAESFGAVGISPHVDHEAAKS